MSESDLPSHPAASLIAESTAEFTRREKFLTWSGALLCFAGFWFGGRLFHIPTYPHFSASLVHQQTLLSSLIVTAIVYVGCVLIGIVIAGAIGFDGGVFCACVGLCALSLRGGGMRWTLFAADGSGVWVKLIVEMIILASFLAGGTALQQIMHRAGLLHRDEYRHVVADVRDSIDQRAMCLLTNIVVIAIVMMFLTLTDRKAQTLLSVGIASFLGTLAAYFLVPTKPAAWYWAGPLVVGIFGYAMQALNASASWQIGQVTGTFAALARPLPLDYAGAGVAASILGYWMSRRWQHEREIVATFEESQG